MDIIGLCGLHQSIPKIEASHYRGWMELLKRVLVEQSNDKQYRIVRTLEEMKQCQTLYVHSGLYYYGDLKEGFALNLFGGEAGLEQPIKEMEKIKESRTILNSGLCGLEYRLPWSESLYSLKNRVKTQLKFADRINDLKFDDLGLEFGIADSMVEPVVNPMVNQFEKTGKLIIGDSHSGASWEPGFAVYRNDAETLHGALNRGLIEKIKDWCFSRVTHINPLPKVIRINYGNIDIRFHILRQNNPPEASQELLNRLEAQLLDMQKKYDTIIELVVPYPIETPERTAKVPKSVWYKGVPATGTFEQRKQIRDIYCNQLSAMAKKNQWRLIDVVKTEGYLPEHMMEKPRSIHLSPAYYLTPMPNVEPTPANQFFEW
jgi:hypothetical protein